jgi:hypothetical protein
MNQIWVCYCHYKNIPFLPHANALTRLIKEIQVLHNTHKMDMRLVSKTHFKERNYVNIPNYITHATNYCDGTAHAGSDIIIRKVEIVKNLSHIKWIIYRKRI